MYPAITLQQVLQGYGHVYPAKCCRRYHEAAGASIWPSVEDVRRAEANGPLRQKKDAEDKVNTKMAEGALRTEAGEKLHEEEAKDAQCANHIKNLRRAEVDRQALPDEDAQQVLRAKDAESTLCAELDT